MAHVTSFAPRSTIDLSLLVRGMGQDVSAFLMQRREQRRIRRELHAYSDRELGDLGFSRGDIADVAAGRLRR
ncbi:DUF1127 domain-containing protein [Lichenicola cladoniae]|uniref:DUF1127 domain-containing protein n=1 Tax=Lichenicola cladoniae TaxID=1484109 RepID=A0A6M8HUI5_9PROT|nr:DUF1127 domain-containing protein [Lichenicola cladoniae]NPD66140.1 DUF1127 domain-containing protein [Acetobacteraceae bacterium]QKE92008.1 DUF1127 domain-containing protein [Lichenicola cladoniae]